MGASLNFGWFLGTGFGVQGWGEAGYGLGYDWRRPEVYQRAARYFEANELDLFVIQDSVTVPDTYEGSARVNLSSAAFVPKHDPLALTPLLLAATERIAIVPTISASFYEPYTVARLVATLSHFAPGRIGLNLVTSGSDLAAQNYGRHKQIEHDLRYERAAEWLEVIRALWGSWDSRAVVEDPVRGVFVDHTKVHTIDHVGKYFSVRGPLNAVPPREQPLVVQAGSSSKGTAFAGRNADVVLAHASSVERSREFSTAVKAAARTAGRSADDVKVLFVIPPTITANAEHTEAVRASRSELTQKEIDQQLQGISYLTNIDFAQFDLDDRLPRLETNSNRGTLDEFVSSAPRGSTLRQILAARVSSRNQTWIGTAENVADQIETFAEATDADGFLFLGDVHPAAVHRVLDPLIPALRKRALIRSQAGSSGIRANLFGAR